MLTINKPTELLKQYIGRSYSAICFYQKINNIGTFAFSATVCFCVMMDKRDWTKRTKDEELRREKNETNYFFNVLRHRGGGGGGRIL